MSAIGTKRTCLVALHMSAFDPTATLADCFGSDGLDQNERGAARYRRQRRAAAVHPHHRPEGVSVCWRRGGAESGAVTGSAVSAVDRPDGASRPLGLPDKPSIAVLPFTNISGDPDQEYFADGITDDITTALSQFRWLFVIARNSSFVFKGKRVDSRQIARELGVRYLLEGSVRKAGNRLRITGQLVDASSGAHLWADRFDGAVDDVFDLQDKVTASVVGAIGPKLEQAEISRARRKPTESLDAYDYYLRGMACLHQSSKESTSEALQLFSRAIELDADFASAYGMAAFCYDLRKWNSWMADPKKEAAEAERLARRAIALGKDDALALCTGGFALVHVAGDLDYGAACIDRALCRQSEFSVCVVFRRLGERLPWRAGGRDRKTEVRFAAQSSRSVSLLGRARAVVGAFYGRPLRGSG